MTYTNMSTELHDLFIVGGGLVGLVLANWPSEDLSQHVLVLETGSNHSEDPRSKPLDTISRSELNRSFKSVSQVRIFYISGSIEPPVEVGTLWKV
ncbi:hypothetical protein F4810DRAFT_670608, partial [Camillea tinctor]